MERIKIRYVVANNWAVNISNIYMRTMFLCLNASCFRDYDDTLYTFIETYDGEQYMVDVFNLEEIK